MRRKALVGVLLVCLIFVLIVLSMVGLGLGARNNAVGGGLGSQSQALTFAVSIEEFIPGNPIYNEAPIAHILGPPDEGEWQEVLGSVDHFGVVTIGFGPVTIIDRPRNDIIFWFGGFDDDSKIMEGFRVEGSQDGKGFKLISEIPRGADLSPPVPLTPIGVDLDGTGVAEIRFLRISDTGTDYECRGLELNAIEAINTKMVSQFKVKIFVRGTDGPLDNKVVKTDRGDYIGNLNYWSSIRPDYCGGDAENYEQREVGTISYLPSVITVTVEDTDRDRNLDDFCVHEIHIYKEGDLIAWSKEKDINFGDNRPDCVSSYDFYLTTALSPEISNLMALEEELYNKALETIDLQGDNLARITADCIVDIFSLSIDMLLANDEFIKELSDKMKMDEDKVREILDSNDFRRIEGKAEDEARSILHKEVKKHFVEPLTKDQKNSIDSVHQDFLTYMSEYGGEFSADRISECEVGLKISIDALEEAQRLNTGSWNPFERPPFVYLGYRPCQINRVSMAVCGYDWADSSYLAKFASIVYKISGGGVGELITGFGIKPGVVLAAFSTIGADAYNIYAGYDYTFLAIKGEMPFHTHSHLIDDSCTTPISLLSSLLSCPADLHACDSQGRHVGLNETGGIEVEIPNAYYYHNATTNRTEIVIFDSNDTISFGVKALDTGEFNLTNVQGTNETHTTIAYQNIGMETENTTAIVNLNATSANYTMDLDSDGDDIVDDVLSPNSTEVNYFPNASIVSPRNGMNFTKGQFIAFEGSGTDEEDGVLSGSSLIWISSMDGIIGTGCSFGISNLSAGNHTISLTAIDSGGLAGVSRVSITVLPNCWCDSFDNTDKIATSTNITVSGGDVKLNNATKGNLTSIRITPSSLQTWGKFYANDTLLEGTNITYKILNASDNSTFYTINSTQANAGYCISEYAPGVDLIRLYAELNTTNASYTPVLHDWNVSWIPEITPTLIITHAKTDKKIYNLNENVTISCIVQNETGQNISADVVYASITNPAGYSEQISLDEELVGRYNGMFTNTSLAGVYNVTVYANKAGYANDTAELSFEVVSEVAGFDTGAGTYPSIMGTHNGTIKPNQTITVHKLYTYPCTGTGGHTEYAEIGNATATWSGYIGDWKNIPFDKTVVLLANETYNYTIRTGSYPQIHHTDALLAANGWINCTQFIDANGMEYNDWIPAIRLW